MDADKILCQLIESCISGNTKCFIPFLISNNVKTEMPNKTRFYSFFKHMINCAKQNSIGKLSLKIEQAKWQNNKNTLMYNFYDKKHKYARLSIMVTRNNNELILETLPF